MSLRKLGSLTSAAVMSAGLLTISIGAVSASAAVTVTNQCKNLTKSALVADGFTKASKPKVTPYNYKKPSKNAANALGTTYDFGSKSVVVACLSPSDLQKFSVQAQGKSKPTMTAEQYMAYMVQQSQGAMTATQVGGVTDYLDFGNGKEDGVGSTSKAGSVRLDAWVAGNYIYLTFIAPVRSQTPPPALLSLISSTQANAG
jgi:hypothetical protein